MSEDKKAVPEPGEARRDDDEIHYYEIDETNVRDAERPPKPQVDEPEPEGS
jgi:hypothetical protein